MRILSIGDKINRWTILSASERLPNEASCKVLVRCDCGTEKRVVIRSLRNGASKSCGCLKREALIRLNENSPQDVSYRKAYKVYKRNALKRNLVFELTFEEFKDLSAKNCVYCDLEPKPYNAYAYDQKVSKTISDRSWINLNGIDRVNNTIGYKIHNCVTCCGPCNRAKMDASVEEFVSHAARIVEFQKKQSEKHFSTTAHLAHSLQQGEGAFSS